MVGVLSAGNQWTRVFKDYWEFADRLEVKIQRHTKHADNVRKVLLFLALHEPATTWDLRKACFTEYADDKQGESVARRLLVGRTDREKKTDGLVDLGVVSPTKQNDQRASTHYDLTLYGMLYAIAICDFTDQELYKAAKRHHCMIPYIFDKADYLESKHVSLQLLKVITSKEIVKFNDTMTAVPYHHLVNYLIISYPAPKMFVDKFVHFIAYWFYTYLMLKLSDKNHVISKKWKRIVKDDSDIWDLYGSFLDEALSYYEKQNKSLRSFIL